MENYRGFLSGTRQELLIQFIFTLFVIVIPNQQIQLMVLGLGVLIVGLLLRSKQLFDNSLFNHLQLLVKWVVTVGVGYFLFPIPWTVLFPYAHPSITIAFFIVVFIATIWSVVALVAPVTIFFVKYASYDNDQVPSAFIWVFGLLIGQITSWILTAGVGGWLCWLIPVFMLITLFSVLPGNGIWFVSNLIGGIIYSYILNLNDSSLNSRLIFLSMASLSSSMITGLAYLVLFEARLSGSNNFENKKANKNLYLLKAVGQFIVGWFVCDLALFLSWVISSIIGFSGPLGYQIFLGSIFSVGIGLAIRLVRKQTLKWLGIGITVKVVTLVIVIFVYSCSVSSLISLIWLYILPMINYC
jgi:hypothetical protein